MPNFRPGDKRARLLCPTGAAWYLDFDFEDMASRGGLTSCADTFLATAIYCWIVGLEEFVDPLVRKAIDWVGKAIELAERTPRYFEHGTEAMRFYTLGMCKLVLTGEHDSNTFGRFIEVRILYESAETPDNVAASFALPEYILAEAYDEALSLFARTPGMKPPSEATRLSSEGSMCYAIARYRLGLQYSEDEVQKATNSFLRRKMSAWLENGHSVRAANWLLIAHWQADRTAAPRKVLLRCYDYIPAPA